MTFDDYDDKELLELYGQSAALLKEAIENQLKSVISEYEIRHQAILAVCRSRGLVVRDGVEDDTDPDPPTSPRRKFVNRTNER